MIPKCAHILKCVVVNAWRQVLGKATPYRLCFSSLSFSIGKLKDDCSLYFPERLWDAMDDESSAMLWLSIQLDIVITELCFTPR